MSGVTRLPQAPGDDKIQAYRRRLVAALKIQGYTLAETVDILANSDPPCINPETGRPWSIAVIGKDLQALKAEWQADARRDMADHFADELAHNRELERRAWQDNDLRMVAVALDQRIKLLGLNAPVKVAPTNAEGDSLTLNIDIGSLTFEQLSLLRTIGLITAPAQPVPADRPGTS